MGAFRSAPGRRPRWRAIPSCCRLGSFEPGALDGAALLEAVSVYTRDLSLWRRAPATDVPPPTPAWRDAGVDAAAGAAIRAHGARLGFWCEPATDFARTTTLIIVDGQGRLEVRVVDSAGLDGPELYRAIALKLRAVLAATIGPEVAAIPGAPPRASSASPVPAAVVSPSAGAAPGPPSIQLPVGGAGPAVVVPAPPGRAGRSDSSARSATFRISTPLRLRERSNRGRRRGRRALRARRRAGARSGHREHGRREAPARGRSRCSIFPDRPRSALGPSGSPASARGGWRLYAGGASVVGHGRRADGRAAGFLRSRGWGRCAQRSCVLRSARSLAAEARLCAELPLPSTTYWVQGEPGGLPTISVLDSASGCRAGLPGPLTRRPSDAPLACANKSPSWGTIRVWAIRMMRPPRSPRATSRRWWPDAGPEIRPAWMLFSRPRPVTSSR